MTVEQRDGAEVSIIWELAVRTIKLRVESPEKFKISVLSANRAVDEIGVPVEQIEEVYVAFYQLDIEPERPQWSVVEFDEETFVIVRIRGDVPEISMALGVDVTIEKK